VLDQKEEASLASPDYSFRKLNNVRQENRDRAQISDAFLLLPLQLWRTGQS
jgi:hypothetical protein